MSSHYLNQGYVQPYQLTYEMYSNPIQGNLVYDFQKITLNDPKNFNQDSLLKNHSCIQTSASEHSLLSSSVGVNNKFPLQNDYYSSYKEYLNSKFNEGKQNMNLNQTQQFNERYRYSPRQRRSSSKSAELAEGNVIGNNGSQMGLKRIPRSMSTEQREGDNMMMFGNNGNENNMRPVNKNFDEGKLIYHYGDGDIRGNYGYRGDIRNGDLFLNENKDGSNMVDNMSNNANIGNRNENNQNNDNNNNFDAINRIYNKYNNREDPFTSNNNEQNSQQCNFQSVSSSLPNQNEELQLKSQNENNNNTQGEIPQSKTLFEQPQGNMFNQISNQDGQKDSLYNQNTDNYLNNNNNVNKRNELNEPNTNEQYIIGSLNEIAHLSPQEQIAILFNNNRALGQSLRLLQSQYDNLKNEYDKAMKLQGIEKNSNSKDFKNMLIKENNELKALNKKYENVLEPLVDYVNEINVSMGKDEIDLNQIKKMTCIDEKGEQNSPDNNNDNQLEQFKNFLNDCHKDITSQIEAKNNEMAQIQKKPKKSQKKQIIKHSANDNNKEEQTRGNKFISDQFYGYDYYGDRNNCFACNLGCNCSSRGFSPLMCSPNRVKYIKKEVIK